MRDTLSVSAVAFLVALALLGVVLAIQEVVGA